MCGALKCEERFPKSPTCPPWFGPLCIGTLAEKRWGVSCRGRCRVGDRVSLPPASWPFLMLSQGLHLLSLLWEASWNSPPPCLLGGAALPLFSLRAWDADSLRWRHPVCRKINRQLKQGCESEKTTGLRAADNVGRQLLQKFRRCSAPRTRGRATASFPVSAAHVPAVSGCCFVRPPFSYFTHCFFGRIPSRWARRIGQRTPWADTRRYGTEIYELSWKWRSWEAEVALFCSL